MTTISVKDGAGTSQTITLLPSTVVVGQKTVTTAGTAEALGSSTTLYKGVYIKADHANAGMIYVGISTTDADGYVLDAGESVFYEIDNLSSVYIDADNDGEGASYLGS